MKHIALAMFEKILILFSDDFKKNDKNILLKVTPL